MKKFLIAGNIVDTDADKMSFEDVTPAQVNAFIKNLKPDEEIEFEINSFGGSCTAGLSISNMIRQASIDGHKSTAYIMGIAASMASVVACACDNIKFDNNAFMMIHLPWTVTEGNANDLRKEAETLDKFRDALLAIYRTKFDVSDSIILQMMENETWFLGEQAEQFKLKCEVVFNEEPIKAVALKKIPKFNNTPKTILDLMEINNMDNENLKDDVVPEKIVIEKVTETTETKKETETIIKTPIEETEKIEEPIVENVFKEDDEEEDDEEDDEYYEKVPSKKEIMIAKSEADKRVSGMQSKMAKQIDSLKKDYEAKINDLTFQIKVKDEELTKATANVINLNNLLDKANKELSDKTSALMEKTNALATLNASVNTPNEPTNWKALKGKEFFDWYSKNY